jgi:hypothetical protein
MRLSERVSRVVGRTCGGRYQTNADEPSGSKPQAGTFVNSGSSLHQMKKEPYSWVSRSTEWFSIAQMKRSLLMDLDLPLASSWGGGRIYSAKSASLSIFTFVVPQVTQPAADRRCHDLLTNRAQTCRTVHHGHSKVPAIAIASTKIRSNFRDSFFACTWVPVLE